MTGVFEVLASDDTEKRLASRQFAVLANLRVEERFGDFFRAASNEEEFDARLALISDDVDSVIAQAGDEVGHTASWTREQIVNRFRPVTATRTAAVVEARKPKLCPYHKEVMDIGLQSGDPKAGYEAMASHWGGPRHCDGDDYEGGNCNFKPEMTTQSYWDDKATKAEERKEQREQEAQEQADLEAQQAEEPEETPEIDEPVAEDSVEPVDNVVDFPTPDAGNSDAGATETSEPTPSVQEVPMAMAASFREADLDSKTADLTFHCSACGAQGTYDPTKGNGYREVFAGKQCKHCGAYDTIAKGPAPAKEASTKTADQLGVIEHQDVNQGGGGPEPKIDKRKWTPQTVREIEGIDNPKGPHPTKRKDILEPTRPTNGDKPAEIGEQVTEHQDVSKDSNPTDTRQPTQTWGQGGSAVSSTLKNDVNKNPIRELMETGFDGFVPQAVVQQAIAKKRN